MARDVLDEEDGDVREHADRVDERHVEGRHPDQRLPVDELHEPSPSPSPAQALALALILALAVSLWSAWR